MKQKMVFSFLVCLLVSPYIYGQLQKTIHQSFVLPDSTSTLLINLPEDDIWEVVPWSGNSIMTESNIKMYSANKGIFNFFIEKGRYEYQALEKGDSLALAGEHTKRLVVKAGAMECTEEVQVRIFIPDTFVEEEYGLWKRPLEKKADKDTPRIKKKLNREKIEVSEALQEEVKPLEPVSDSLSQRAINPVAVPDSIDLKKEMPDSDDKGTGN
jgi:hypothetical protein